MFDKSKPSQPHKFHASLQDFVTTAQLGSLQLGMFREQVREIMGQCEAWSIEDGSEQKAKVWKYGILQLWFREDTLSYIGLYPEIENNLPQNIIFEGYLPNANTSLNEFTGYLQANNLHYDFDKDFAKDFGTKLVVESKTNVIFHETGLIHSIFVMR